MLLLKVWRSQHAKANDNENNKNFSEWEDSNNSRNFKEGNKVLLKADIGNACSYS